MKCRMDKEQRDALIALVKRVSEATVCPSDGTRKARAEAEARFHELFADEMELREPTEWVVPKGTPGVSDA